MTTDFRLSLSRRTLVLGGGSAVLAAARWKGTARAAATGEYRIAAQAGRASLFREDPPPTDVWSYNGQVPGPVLRLRQGEPVRIVVENRLEQDTTVHWHGIRLQNGMDGVPGLTQTPIKPGESFTYSFTPPDALVPEYLKMTGTLGVERSVVVQASVYGSDNECTAAAVEELGLHRARVRTASNSQRYE